MARLAIALVRSPDYAYAVRYISRSSLLFNNGLFFDEIVHSNAGMNLTNSRRSQHQRRK